MRKTFTFIDLFAGIGGFHEAAKNLGGVCVYASEIDEKAQEVYKANFSRDLLHRDISITGDIVQEVEQRLDTIPAADFVFGGFPCQPFSKGGYRRGFADTRGTLFFSIAKIIDYRQPPYVLLENVPNLVSHDNGHTLETIIFSLKKLGYSLNKEILILSPSQFGVPVHRPRLYLPAIRKDISPDDFLLDLDYKPLIQDAFSLVDKDEKHKDFYISDYEERVLEMWNDFYKNIDIKVIGFPVWADEFTVKKTPTSTNLPKWKLDFINKNKELYKRNKKFIDEWRKKHHQLAWVQNTHRKFEWQAGTHIKSIWEGLIQFRPSGIRVRRPDKFSTLVAMNHPQIVGPYRRRLTPDETKRLQSFPEDFLLHPINAIAYKQLGNAVNVQVVQAVVKAMRNISK